MSLPVRVGQDAKADLGSLARPLLVEALGFIVALKSKPLLGSPLTHHAGVGDLSDCRKLYFDKARHRVVYRLVPNETSPQAVEIVAVGPRASLKVYYDAARRLGRKAG